MEKQGEKHLQLEYTSRTFDHVQLSPKVLSPSYSSTRLHASPRATRHLNTDLRIHHSRTFILQQSRHLAIGTRRPPSSHLLTWGRNNAIRWLSL